MWAISAYLAASFFPWARWSNKSKRENSESPSIRTRLCWSSRQTTSLMAAMNSSSSRCFSAQKATSGIRRCPWGAMSRALHTATNKLNRNGQSSVTARTKCWPSSSGTAQVRCPLHESRASSRKMHYSYWPCRHLFQLPPPQMADRRTISTCSSCRRSTAPHALRSRPLKAIGDGMSSCQRTDPPYG